MFRPSHVVSAVGPLGTASVMVTALQSLYGVSRSISEFLQDHVEKMKRSDDPTVSRTGKVLEASKDGFGIGYITSVVIIATGQILLGNTLNAITTVATAATMTNPMAMTCAAVGAVYYGWFALNDEERGNILDKLSRGLELGGELIKSMLRFAIDKAKELLSPKNFEEVRKYISSAAQVFGKGLGDVTRKVSDMAGDTFRTLKRHAGEGINKSVEMASDAYDSVKEKAGDLACSTRKALNKIVPKKRVKSALPQIAQTTEDIMTPLIKTEISEPALLIRINRLYRPGMSTQALYEVTRGVWRIGDRRENAAYALAVVNGMVQEVYAINSWHPAASTPYQTRDKSQVEIGGRWEFVGEVAGETVRGKYFGQSVAHYFKKGDQNPVKYVNC